MTTARANGDEAPLDGIDSFGTDDSGECDVIDPAERPTYGRGPSMADVGDLTASVSSAGSSSPEPTEEEKVAAKMRAECSAVDSSKYHIEPDDIGCGNYGIIRLCRSCDTGRKYALKSIPKTKAVQKDMGVNNAMKPGAIQREATFLKSVQHPHIIRLVDTYEDAKCLHLVTEMCTGGMMFDRIIATNRRPYTERQAAGLVKSVLDAVTYLHDECNIVHRDIKVENLLFETDKPDCMTIKLIDFGMSRTDPIDVPMRTSIGTAYYVAPEVLDKSYGKSCDLWSVGVVAYMILCGYYPFYGDNTSEIIKLIKKGKFDYPAAEWNRRSSGVKDFVSALLTVDVSQRPTAAQALRHPWIVKQTKPKKSFSKSLSKGFKKRMSSLGKKSSHGK